MTSGHPDQREHLEAILAGIARETGATVSAYPRPGNATERIPLRDSRDQRATQFEFAQIEDDGTLRVAGHDTGPLVSDARFRDHVLRMAVRPQSPTRSAGSSPPSAATKATMGSPPCAPTTTSTSAESMPR